MAILHGYKNTLRYQLGLALGVFLLMSLSGLFSAALLNVFPALEPILRYLGAAYIFYLACVILKASYTFTERDIKPLGVGNGFVLQILNPKLSIYAFSLFGTFLTPATGNFILVVLLALVLAIISFCATTTWALFGTGIKNYLQHPQTRTLINVLFSLALVYSAVSLLEII